MEIAKNKPYRVAIVDPITGQPVKLPTNFSELDDTPSSYVGQAGSGIRVNATEDGLEFGAGITDVMVFKGAIALPADFPTLGLVQVGWFYSITASVVDNDATKTNTGQSFLIGDEIVWDGSAWVVVGNNSSNLQGAYDIGSDILVTPGRPLQIRDNGIANTNASLYPGLYIDTAQGGLAFGLINDGSIGVPGLAGGQQVILDTSVTFPAGDQIEFGVDLSVAGGAVITPLAVVGTTVNFLAGGIINLKGSDVLSNDGQYIAVGFANGVTTNSIAIVVDALTQAPPTFTATTGTAKAFNQAYGFNGSASGGGPRHSFLSLADGDGSGKLTGVYNDGGNWSSLSQYLNAGDLSTSMIELVNGGPAFGYKADVPFITMGGFGVNPDSADINFSIRATDPTATSSVTSNQISFNADPTGTIVKADGGLLALGYKPGATVVISGSTSNNGGYTVQSVTDTVLTINQPSGLTNEVSGSNVTMDAEFLSDGGMWYNSTDQKYKFWNGTTKLIEDIGSGGGAIGTLQDAYNNSANPATIAISNVKPFDIQAGGNLVFRVIGNGNNNVQITGQGAAPSLQLSNSIGNSYAALGFTGVANDPTNTPFGSMWFDTTLDRLRFRNNTQIDTIPLLGQDNAFSAFSLNPVASFQQFSGGSIVEFIDSSSVTRGQVREDGKHIINAIVSGESALSLQANPDGYHINFSGVNTDNVAFIDGDFWYNNVTDRLNLGTSGGQETLAYLSDITGGGNTLQQAYDQGGSGAGRIITTSGNTTPFELRTSGITNNILKVRETSFGLDTVILTAGGTLLLDRLTNGIGVHVTGNHTSPAFQATNDFNTKPFCRYNINGNGVPSTVWAVEQGGRMSLTPFGNVNAIDINNSGTGLDINATNWSVTQAGVVNATGFSSAGTPGIDGTFTFGGGATGDIATMTFSKGLLTSTVLVP